MNRITTNVDQKLLRTTKFPPEFSQKVDTSKIHIPVIKNWAAGEVSKILNYEDDVVIGLLFDLLEGSKYPDIKSLQIQLTGFLGKDAALFCKELWNLCLDAQKSDTGIPKQLVEAKKLELIQEKLDSERAAEEARRRRDEEREREREVEDVRFRERRDRGRGRGGGGRDSDRRPPRDYSRSPPPRHHRGPPASSRDADSYMPRRDTGRRGDGRYRSRSRSGRRRSPSPKRRRVNTRSPSHSPDRRGFRRENDYRRGYSPRPRDRSPVRRYSRSPSRSRGVRHNNRYRSRSRSHYRSRSRSQSARKATVSGDRASRSRRGRSSSPSGKNDDGKGTGEDVGTSSGLRVREPSQTLHETTDSVQPINGKAEGTKSAQRATALAEQDSSVGASKAGAGS